ncbi:MAG: hypothetical protein ABII23_00850 [bacterium]
MVQLIDKLTEKIYQEGVEKAKAEGQSIIAQAEEEKKNIIAQGKTEAQSLIADAQQKAAELTQSAEADIRMASQKALATIRQKIEEVITVSIAGDAADEVVSDKNIGKKIIETMIEKWDDSDYSNEALIIKLPPEDAKSLESYFFKQAKKILKEGLIFKADSKIKSGFVIEQQNGKFKVGFTGDDFAEFFACFLRPKIKEFLFGSKKK